MEPIVGNMGVIPPAPGFLEGLRAACHKAGAAHPGRGHDRLRAVAVPKSASASGGTSRPSARSSAEDCRWAAAQPGEILRHFALAGSVYQSGTLSGNPLATAAGVATLQALAEPGVYERLEASGKHLQQALNQASRESDIPCQINRAGSMWTIFFTATPVVDAATARTADRARYARFFHGMLERGVYLPPSQFEAAFISSAHGPAEIDATWSAARAVFPALH